jgi:predicted GH43/DUF377 family glycosyl hydrolase
MYIYDPLILGCYAGWRRNRTNPVIGEEYGETYDVCVLPREGFGYRMYLSWRSKRSIAVTESGNGFGWFPPRIVLDPRKETGWEEDVNRMSVVKKDGKYYMWYSGQTMGSIWDNTGTSKIGYAVSDDGINWERFPEPVMVPDQKWEQNCIMCPHVNWNEEKKIYQMYYSAGGWAEPDAIGYAESKDGRSWQKYDNPVFGPVYENLWERERTTACQVLFHKGWYYMFYIGFEDIHKARVCFARSRDGIENWERHPMNPIICPGELGSYDCEGEYKPFLVWEEDNKRWLMWVNGRRGPIEHIGVMIHDGEDLGFDDPVPKTEYEK